MNKNANPKAKPEKYSLWAALLMSAAARSLSTCCCCGKMGENEENRSAVRSQIFTICLGLLLFGLPAYLVQFPLPSKTFKTFARCIVYHATATVSAAGGGGIGGWGGVAGRGSNVACMHCVSKMCELWQLSCLMLSQTRVAAGGVCQTSKYPVVQQAQLGKV